MSRFCDRHQYKSQSLTTLQILSGRTVYVPPNFKMTVIRKKPVVRTCYLTHMTVLCTHRKKPSGYESHTREVWAPTRKGHKAGSMILSQGPGRPIIAAHTYLLVYLGPTFYFSYYHSYNGTPVGCGKGKELLVGGDVTIP